MRARASSSSRVEACGVGFERERRVVPASRSRASSRTRRCRCPRWVATPRRCAPAGRGHVPQPFAQLVGSGEAEMADLIQVLDAHVAARAARDQQRADRFDVAIGGLRDPRRPARQRRPRRFDRVELVGLAVAAALLAVRTIDLDHHQALAAQMTRQAGAIRAGAFHPDPIDRTERRPANRATRRNPAGVVANDSTPNTPPFASTAAATCTSACVSTPPVTGRVVSTMVIAIPSASTVQGVARTSREGDRDEHAALTASSITLRNGACPIPDPRQRSTRGPTGTYKPPPTPRWTPHQHPPILTGRSGVRPLSRSCYLSQVRDAVRVRGATAATVVRRGDGAHGVHHRGPAAATSGQFRGDVHAARA